MKEIMLHQVQAKVARQAQGERVISSVAEHMVGHMHMAPPAVPLAITLGTGHCCQWLPMYALCTSLGCHVLTVMSY